MNTSYESHIKLKPEFSEEKEDHQHMKHEGEKIQQELTEEEKFR